MCRMVAGSGWGEHDPRQPLGRPRDCRTEKGRNKDRALRRGLVTEVKYWLRGQRPTEEQLPSASPRGKPGSAAPEAGQFIPDMLLPQDFKPRQQPATPHSLRPAPATGGVRRLIGRGTRCCVLIGYTSPVLFRACSGLHFVSIGSRRLVQDGVVIRDSLVGCLIRASFLPGEGRKLGG